MQWRDMKAGMRVRVTRRIDHPLDAVAVPEGELGIVAWVAERDAGSQPVALVALDNHFRALDTWGNELQVFAAEDGPGECTAADFEPVMARGDVA